jgi:RHS repeat-associated protein
VYDGLGRNTSIPAADSPNSVGVISLSYRVNDQVASITQNGVTTAYSFDGLGRRVSETTGSSVVTKHYTGTSDNPAWSSNNAGVTDIYTSSLGTGLNGTVTLDNGVKTLSLDVNDLRGNTVTRINVDTATTDSWVSFDEYGNREGASTGKLVTYDAYGQYERATTSQGLILMGARVYNPVTNQFTSPDPVTGGNETSYTYPNDPINKNDFTGLMDWAVKLALTLVLDFAFNLMSAAGGPLGLLFQLIKPILTSVIVSLVEMVVDQDFSARAFRNMLVSAMFSAITGPFFDRLAGKLSLGKVWKKVTEFMKSAIRSALSTVAGFVSEESLEAIGGQVNGVLEKNRRINCPSVHTNRASERNL